MNASASNSSSTYYWADCDPYAGGGPAEPGGPSLGLLTLFATYSLEFLLGVPSNLWLISHILGKRSKVGASVQPADFFPLQVAAVQGFFYLAMPLLLANHLLWRSRGVMTLVSALSSTTLIVKPLLLCLECVERYVAAVRPLAYPRFKACRWGCLAACALVYALSGSSVFTGRTDIGVCAVLLPVLAVNNFCSLSVLQTLRRPPPGDQQMAQGKKRKKEGDGEDNRSSGEEVRWANGRRRARGEMNSMRRKAFVTILIIQAVFTFNYLPSIVALLLRGRVSPVVRKCQYQAAALAAAASFSYLQPLLLWCRRGRPPCLKLRR